jgi:hypothetical protein
MWTIVATQFRGRSGIDPEVNLDHQCSQEPFVSGSLALNSRKIYSSLYKIFAADFPGVCKE